MTSSGFLAPGEPRVVWPCPARATSSPSHPVCWRMSSTPSRRIQPPGHHRRRTCCPIPANVLQGTGRTREVMLTWTVTELVDPVRTGLLFAEQVTTRRVSMLSPARISSCRTGFGTRSGTTRSSPTIPRPAAPGDGRRPGEQGDRRGAGSAGPITSNRLPRSAAGACHGPQPQPFGGRVRRAGHGRGHGGDGQGSEENPGDSLEAFHADLTWTRSDQFLADPRAEASVCSRVPTTRVVYDLTATGGAARPRFAATLAREIHVRDPGGDQRRSRSASPTPMASAARSRKDPGRAGQRAHAATLSCSQAATSPLAR